MGKENYRDLRKVASHLILFPSSTCIRESALSAMNIAPVSYAAT
jgi:hypothetical protein